MSLFLDQNQLQKFYDASKVDEFCTLVRAHIVTLPGQRLNTQIGAFKSGQNGNTADIYLESKNEVLGKIGFYYKTQNISKKPVSTPEKKPRLLSLNLGSFGLNSSNNEKGEEYVFLQEKFLKYL